ncbi:MAG: YtxH domain-containing protein [Chloroflexota bacterium]|nr:YtxH domain-containing protein [Chloroflexota bacterium]
MFGVVVRFVGGFLVGAATGAVTGILLAPKSGEALKQDIDNYWHEVIDAGKQAEMERRIELNQQFEQAKRFNSTGY